jgi:class 3 adenylate cyclase
MSETRKLTTIMVTDMVAFSRLTAVQEELTLARLGALRSDLIDPLIAVYHGRVPEDEPARHQSIVVLPCDNLSGDPKQD